jgi:hypothetical protein
MLVVVKGSELNSEGATTIPLLTLLVISEFAFIVTAIGTYIGARHMLSAGIKTVYMVVTIICAILSVRFLFLGIELWPL